MRLHTLDYLRGIAACGIMVYHMISWNYGVPDPGSFLGKVGIYAVSIFYVLSGLTLYHVYYRKMEVKTFFIKRFFRIYPLLWLVTLGTIALGARPSIETLVLNLTGAFGIVRPWDYIGTGVWSIGNELAFYLLFPLLVIFGKKFRWLLWGLVLILLAVYIYFAYYLKGDWWKDYVNPLNQAFLFAAGFMIGYLKVKFKTLPALGLIAAGLALFILIPVFSTLDLVTGGVRLALTVVVILICLGFYNVHKQLPKPLHWFLSRVGEASYSIYMIHPLVYKLLWWIPEGWVKVVVTVGVTLVLSYLCYITLEKYFIGYGNRVTKKGVMEPAL